MSTLTVHGGVLFFRYYSSICVAKESEAVNFFSEKVAKWLTRIGS